MLIKINIKSNILLLTFLFLTLITFSSTGFARFVPGGGGVTAPPTPTLNQPISPDYDNSITLSWNYVSGATSYCVYRSTSQSGVYSLVATISSTSYTNNRDMGLWWYCIKACNAYGSSNPSNTVGVMVPNQYNQPYSEGGYIYSPINTVLYSSSYDNAVISINTKQDTDEQGNVYNNHPWFNPVIMVTLNPDSDPNPPPPFHTQFNYIHSFKLGWKMKNPNGDYLSKDNIDEILTKYYSLEGEDDYTEMNRLVDFVSALYGFIPYSCSDLLKALIVPSYTHSTFAVGYDTNYDFWVKWTEGYTDLIIGSATGSVANNRLEEASMYLTLASWLPSISGAYSLEFSWEIVVHNYDSDFNFITYTTRVNHEYAFTLTGDYSLTFNFN